LPRVLSLVAILISILVPAVRGAGDDRDVDNSPHDGARGNARVAGGVRVVWREESW
jgi:hypothetical protein